ncbi:MAG: type II toxin-antitoxin system HipA family toxin [Gammaproteobacteria bacterium]|nr:type II toxin-antitoxin system HipA family toxin [Gammaproteobacteria bacterium]
MTKALSVWWEGTIVGSFQFNRHGEAVFAYSEDWISSTDPRPVSVSLPLRSKPFSRRASRPFFEGLLPEEEQRIAVAKALGISEHNEFGLLEALGGEVAGALTLWPEGEAPPVPVAPNSPPKVMNESELIDLLDTLPSHPLLAGDSALRLSLAGAQSKLPVIATGQGIALPQSGAPTTHILKPVSERFPGITENEAFCMRLAQDIGLNVAPVEIRTIGNRRVLLVERYDRTMVEGQVRRLHQEDFCQALGLPSSRKYAAEGGPTLGDCFALVRRTATRPAKDVLKLFDAAAFNLIIGNADAHGKNFSLLHRRSSIELAPLYDLVCTVAYPNISPKMAMKIAKRSTLDAIKATDWKVLGTDIGMTEPYVRRRVLQLTDAVEGHMESATVPFNSTDAGAATLSRITDKIRGRIANLRRIC